MPQILHTVLEPAQTLAAAAEQFRFDLPVNPLSAIIITARAHNNTLVLANAAPGAAALISKLSNVRTRYRGATIFDGDPLDLIMVYGGFSGWWPMQHQVNNSDNDVRGVTFALLFGRMPYDPRECFPATRRGDLTLEIDTGANPTGLDGFELNIETVELLDAAPERFIKVTTTQHLMEAGDVNDISLPIGNLLLGALLRGDSFPNGATNDSSFDEVALEVDNVEVGYSRTFWHALHALWGRRARLDWLTYGHLHTIGGSGAAAAAYAQATAIGISADANNASLTTGTAARSGITGIAPETEVPALQRYGWLELDPRGDLSYALDTRNAADVSLHVNSAVADATASRVLPIEYVSTGAAAGGAAPA